MELYLGEERPGRNPINGQYLKGHKNIHKGVPRSKWMDKEKDKLLRKTSGERLRRMKEEGQWTGGRPKKSIVCLNDTGDFCIFTDPYAAAKRLRLKENARSLIARCCRDNKARHVNQKTGKINTDHKYLGFRWYYEADNIWTQKVRL